jgi:hypothetical protein
VAVILNGALVVRPLIGELVDATSAMGAPPDVGTTEWAMPAAAAVNIAFAATSATLAVFKPGRRLRRRAATSFAARDGL